MKGISEELGLFLIDCAQHANNKRVTTADLILALLERDNGLISDYIKQNTEFKTFDSIFNEIVYGFLDNKYNEFNDERLSFEDCEQILDERFSKTIEDMKKRYEQWLDVVKKDSNKNKKIISFEEFCNNILKISRIPVVLENKTKNEMIFLTPFMYKFFKDMIETDDMYDENKCVLVYDVEVQLVTSGNVNLALLLEWFKLDIKEFAKQLQANETDSDSYLKEFRIPKKMSEYCECLNDQYEKGKPCEILGRDEELEDLWDVLSKREKRNVILVGEAGVGKSAIIERLTWQIVNEECPKQFLNFKVVTLQVNSIIAGTTLRGQAEKRFKDVTDFLNRRQDIILFIDEIHTMIGAGETSSEGSLDFSNSLKPILAGKNSRVVGATTAIEYNRYFSLDPAFKRRFEKIDVKEPEDGEVIKMIGNKVVELRKTHGIDISDKMIEKSIFVSQCFSLINRNPDRTLDLIDRVMTKAKRLNKTEVDEECFFKVYAKNYQKYTQMSEFQKKRVAYHEMGHYMLSDNTKAVTIIPTDDFLGANIVDLKKERSGTEQEKLDEISSLLGGRIAEKIFSKEYSSGASSDLKKATLLAYEMITKYGMRTSIGKHRVYIEQSDSFRGNNELVKMINDKLRSDINREIDYIISQCYNKAESYIIANKGLLEQLVEAILERKIMDKKELDEIRNNYFRNKTKK
ncbi:MAG: AAA family ATPase [Clostridia bacterium]|nr:AAA family ATPase [Clostridia bacterium]